MAKNKTATEAALEENGAAERERIEVLAQRVQLLFGFCVELIPDKDLLDRVAKYSDSRVGHVQAMAPIIGAFGMDWEVAEFETRLKARRARALYDLINTLEITEKERLEFHEKQGARAKGRAELSRVLGL